MHPEVQVPSLVSQRSFTSKQLQVFVHISPNVKGLHSEKKTIEFEKSVKICPIYPDNLKSHFGIANFIPIFPDTFRLALSSTE